MGLILYKTNREPWPAEERALRDETSKEMGILWTEKVKRDEVVQKDLETVRSAHVDRMLPVEVFGSEWIDLGWD